MIRKLIMELLGRRPSPKKLRETAEELRTEADHLDKLAGAIEADRKKPPDQRIRKRSPKAGPGRDPGTHVVINRKYGKTRVRVGRSLWYELNSPERFNLQILQGTFTITPASGDVGWKVISNNQAPIITCTSADDIVPPDGIYSAQVVGRSIKVGQRISD